LASEVALRRDTAMKARGKNDAEGIKDMPETGGRMGRKAE